MVIPELFERIIGVVAGGFTVTAQLTYLINIIRKKVRPSILSWLGWGMLMGASFISQVVSKGWEWSQTGLVLGAIGCFIVATFAIVLKQFMLKKGDWIFFVLGIICIFIYLSSKNPWYTTVYAITADFLLSLPTFLKAYKNPESEKTIAWNFGLASWTLSLLICLNHDLLYALFPIYLFLFNLTMFVLTHRKVIPIKLKTSTYLHGSITKK